jgi:hypothetical protein
MADDKPFRRLTLRDLITHAEKGTRALADHLNLTALAQISDFRDLSRPVRRRTHYPTLAAVDNALKSLLATASKAQAMADELQEQFEEIRERAKRERVNRL